MSLAKDLLEQARHLATREPKRPKQASLRRAISAAYYALFHLLASEAAGKLAPSQPAGLKDAMQRAFAHGEMKAVCKAFSGTPANLPRPANGLVVAPLQPELQKVAKAFVELREARHSSDYDLTFSVTKIDAQTLIQTVDDAFASWAVVRGSANANVFLAAMLLQGKWSR